MSDAEYNYKETEISDDRNMFSRGRGLYDHRRRRYRFNPIRNNGYNSDYSDSSSNSDEYNYYTDIIINDGNNKNNRVSFVRQGFGKIYGYIESVRMVVLSWSVWVVECFVLR